MKFSINPLKTKIFGKMLGLLWEPVSAGVAPSATHQKVTAIFCHIGLNT
tara:strand:- start:209 stop:355 length:147 start_codon:yes stop_codon:yes gene_type:complete